MKLSHTILLFFLMLVARDLGPAQSLDRIVGVVDREIILESELDAQVQFFVFNNRVDASTPGLKEQVLDVMINEKLLVAKAIEDSVTVGDEEVQQRLDQLIQQRIQQVGSEARLEELYGMPISKIKREFRDQMRKNLLSERLQQQRFAVTRIARREVEEFFRLYKDSLGIVPEQVDLAHIAIKLKPGAGASAAAVAKANALRDSLIQGADFADLALRHSQDPGSSSRGGDLGFVRRGQFVKEFETAVFALAEGEISEPVETEFGLHVIELLERRGDAVHPRHILIRIDKTESDRDTIITMLDSLRTRALRGDDFALLAKQYSEYKETALIGGSLGITEVNNVDQSILPAITGLQGGEIGQPTPLTIPGFDGYHIVLVRSRIPEHLPSLEQDYDRIETLALNLKRSQEYSAWLEELRTSIYWESRL
ncbi:MAG: peptidylprolyl isomerase [Ignavibacteria bacterium]|nr:peptidylprolyl isomerase [Ignavibacteria bacterium]